MFFSVFSLFTLQTSLDKLLYCEETFLCKVSVLYQYTSAENAYKEERIIVVPIFFYKKILAFDNAFNPSLLYFS